MSFHLTTITDGKTVDGSYKSDVDLAPLALGALTDGVTAREMAAIMAYAMENDECIQPYWYTGKSIFETDKVFWMETLEPYLSSSAEEIKNTAARKNILPPSIPPTRDTYTRTMGGNVLICLYRTPASIP